jgi:hypothetical protein
MAIAIALAATIGPKMIGTPESQRLNKRAADAIVAQPARGTVDDSSVELGASKS